MMKKTILSLVLMAPTMNGQAQEAKTQMTKAYQLSAFELFNAVANNETANVCFSPLSVQIALSMLQNGAAGNTLSQLQQALGTTGLSNEEIGAFNKQLAKTLTARPTYDEEVYRNMMWDPDGNPREVYDGWFPQCELANALWTRPDAQLYEEFMQALRNDYDACVDAVNFDTWEGINKINNWVSDHTHGLIPKLYDEPQSNDLDVVLMNALYFKGSWSKPFAPELTEQGKFFLNDETYTTVDMMLARDVFQCAVTPSFQTITMDYGTNGDFSMTIFVPLEGYTLPPLTYEDWNAAQQLQYQHVNLYMPRFVIDGKYDLKTVLKGMGVTDAFDEMADFTKMSEVNRAISAIYQLSKIIVDEKGTEAAALTVIEEATGIDLTRPEDYQDFKVDRPFYFTIQSRKANTILFAGRVNHLDGPIGVIDGISLTPAPSPVREGSIYNLNGQRLMKPQRGVNIVNGRKVVVK
jgi:serpin B